MVEVKDSYDEEATEVFQKWVDLSFTRGCAYPSAFGALGPISGRNIVDFGCGAGEFLRMCKRKGAAELFGYEGSEAMLAEAKKNDLMEFDKDVIRYQLSDCFKPIPDLPPDHYDLATANFLIPHCDSIEGLRQFFNSVFQVLKPGGRFSLVTIPFYVADANQQAIIEHGFGYRCAIRPKSATDPIMAPSIAMKPNVHVTDHVNEHAKFTDEVYFEFKEYYWRRGTIMNCLYGVGFSKVEDTPRLLHEDFENDLVRKVLELPVEDFYVMLVAEK